MQLPVPPVDRTTCDRLEAVRRYDVLDPPVDGTFDRVAGLAAAIFGTPIASVTIVDEDRVWFAATQGLDGVRQVGTEPGLCASAVLTDGPYVVEDAAADPRTFGHPLVRGELGLRFYAAAPIVVEGRHRLGTVNVIDRQPRTVTPEQTAMLESLAAIVADHLELRLAALASVRGERVLRVKAERDAADAARQVAVALRTGYPVGDPAAIPAACQLGGAKPCPRRPELKIADSWGDSAWGCVHHVEEALLSGASMFVADESMAGVVAFQRRGRRTTVDLTDRRPHGQLSG
jgi:GAF domain-containing protein